MADPTCHHHRMRQRVANDNRINRLPFAMEKDDVVAMEELVDEEEEGEEEDVGPSYNPELFKFLLEDVSSRGNV
jgi:hypothetical protein